MDNQTILGIPFNRHFYQYQPPRALEALMLIWMRSANGLWGCWPRFTHESAFVMAGKYQAYPEYKDSGVEWLGRFQG